MSSGSSPGIELPHLHRERATSWRILLLAADALWCWASLITALRWNLGRESAGIGFAEASLALPLTVVCFHLAGAYSVRVPGRASEWTRAGLRGLGLLLVVVMVVLYLTSQALEFPRLAFIAWALAAAALVTCSRILLSLVVQSVRRGEHANRAILVGPLANCLSVQEHLRRHPDLDILPVGIASDDPPPPGTADVVPVGSAASIAMGRGAVMVLVCTDFGDQRLIERLTDDLLPFPLEVRLLPGSVDFPLFCQRIEDLHGQASLVLSSSPLTPTDHMVKRLEDILLVLPILVLASPVMLAVAVLVRVFNGPGPIIYAQNRHGYMGCTFTVYKFRTMTWSPDHPIGPDDVSGARAAVDPAKAFLDPTTGIFRQVNTKDLRVTRFGRMLRSTSLDELPQFWNVLKGDMSLVGPRPHARRHNLQFLPALPHLMRRHFIKPGITGLAQVSGARGRTTTVDDMARRLEFDLRYIRTWSLWLDLKILAKTLLVGFYTREP
ncbi:MAG: exopolysaccharide biosynthesis polyprenyl glycosylphosphotransferase [Planctomycetes bacterium]|nr:exopolysaccharide biosynthesis polyprenyl glycosylphosphotransferase [Planctomycetota bacterium]